MKKRKAFVLILLLVVLIASLCSCASSLKIDDIKSNLKRAVYLTKSDSLALEFESSTFKIVTIEGTLVVKGHYRVNDYRQTEGNNWGEVHYDLVIGNSNTPIYYPMPPDSITVNNIVFILQGSI